MTKMMIINCNISTINELTEILENNEVNFYQIFDRVTGKLPIGNPRLNTAIWPGYSVAIQLHCSPDKCQSLKDALNYFNTNNLSEDETVFYSSWNLDD